jgi:hypothetical protein
MLSDKRYLLCDRLTIQVVNPTIKTIKPKYFIFFFMAA